MIADSQRRERGRTTENETTPSWVGGVVLAQEKRFSSLLSVHLKNISKLFLSRGEAFLEVVSFHEVDNRACDEDYQVSALVGFFGAASGTE